MLLLIAELQCPLFGVLAKIFDCIIKLVILRVCLPVRQANRQILTLKNNPQLFLCDLITRHLLKVNMTPRDIVTPLKRRSMEPHQKGVHIFHNQNYNTKHNLRMPSTCALGAHKDSNVKMHYCRSTEGAEAASRWLLPPLSSLVSFSRTIKSQKVHCQGY